jgi:hypothetical protein
MGRDSPRLQGPKATEARQLSDIAEVRQGNPNRMCMILSGWRVCLMWLKPGLAYKLQVVVYTQLSYSEFGGVCVLQFTLDFTT